jgi:hypothetical protein
MILLAIMHMFFVIFSVVITAIYQYIVNVRLPILLSDTGV